MSMKDDRATLRPSWSVLPLRLIVGYGFVAHGYAKVMNGPDRFIAALQALHVPVPALMGWLTIVVELLGGAAILAGAFVTLTSIPLAAILLVATFTVHLPYGFSSIKLRGVTAAGAQFGPPGYETDLLYLACLATLVASGPGPFALDTRVDQRTNHRAEVS
jgi:putative oxidoreductase